MNSQARVRPLIHTAIAAHAARRPDAVALVCDGREISYGMLDAAANSYAADLADRGIGPGRIVPLLMPRSLEMVALELGVLKTGAAYANIDIRWPLERQIAVLDLIKPAVVVTSADTWNGRLGNRCYRPADDGIVGASRGRSFAPPPVPPDAPATIFFTSGTTGVPKGVVSPHQAVTRVFGADGLDGFGPGHATPQVAPAPWDMYAFELWGQLTAGGTVVLVPADYLLPSTLREAVRHHGVDTLWLTASLFNLFVDEDPDCFRGLARVLTGGEKLSPEHVRSFLLRHPTIGLWNVYGPAEGGMLTTTRRLTEADCDVAGGVPIGTPVAGTSVRLLVGEQTQRQPGREGEICILGQGLANGYLGQPELTAEKFPTIDLDGKATRIYRTGDMGVLDDSGVLHFRGRRDRQVKISGHRIELAEIESAADLVPGVTNCIAFAVNAPDGKPSHLALVYLSGPAASPSGAPAGDPLGVHAHLRKTLPAYLVPQVVRCLPRYPVTANGKVDRAALHDIVQRSRPTRPATAVTLR
jgi:D-alanine--poly(phosphoribitol) ligase subunit 1